MIGMRDMFTDDVVCMVEWPDRGEGVLPPPTINIQIDILVAGRRLSINQT